MQRVRKFLIHNKNGEYGHLYYYEDDDKFKVVFKHNLDLNGLPALVYVPVTSDKFVLDKYLSLDWVRERIVPPNRSNINEILADNGMTYYNEVDILMKSRGICCMDDLTIDFEEYIDEDDVKEYEE